MKILKEEEYNIIIYEGKGRDIITKVSKEEMEDIFEEKDSVSSSIQVYNMRCKDDKKRFNNDSLTI